MLEIKREMSPEDSRLKQFLNEKFAQIGLGEDARDKSWVFKMTQEAIIQIPQTIRVQDLNVQDSAERAIEDFMSAIIDKQSPSERTRVYAKRQNLVRIIISAITPESADAREKLRAEIKSILKGVEAKAADILEQAFISKADEFGYILSAIKKQAAQKKLGLLPSLPEVEMFIKFCHGKYHHLDLTSEQGKRASRAAQDLASKLNVMHVEAKAEIMHLRKSLQETIRQEKLNESQKVKIPASDLAQAQARRNALRKVVKTSDGSRIIPSASASRDAHMKPINIGKPAVTRADLEEILNARYRACEKPPHNLPDPVNYSPDVLAAALARKRIRDKFVRHTPPRITEPLHLYVPGEN